MRVEGVGSERGGIWGVVVVGVLVVEVWLVAGVVCCWVKRRGCGLEDWDGDVQRGICAGRGCRA